MSALSPAIRRVDVLLVPTVMVSLPTPPMMVLSPLAVSTRSSPPRPAVIWVESTWLRRASPSGRVMMPLSARITSVLRAAPWVAMPVAAS